MTLGVGRTTFNDFAEQHQAQRRLLIQLWLVVAIFLVLGAAQVASARRAGEQHRDHAWFVNFAPLTRPEIASVVLSENAGFGGTHSAPKAKAIYEVYYRRTRGPEEKKPVVGGL